MACSLCRQVKLAEKPSKTKKKGTSFRVISSNKKVAATMEENIIQDSIIGTKSVYLPSELISNILSRLPIKSLLRCRAVSKEWNNLTRTPQFISSISQQPCTFCFQSFRYNRGLTEFIIFGKDEKETIRIPFERNLQGKPYYVQLSCNGFLLLSPRRIGHTKMKLEFELVIYNPITKETMNIPQCPKGDCSRVSFGYDVKTQKYKLVLGWKYIITLGDTRWRKLRGRPNKELLGRFWQSSVFFHGAFYWIDSYKGIITTFSLDISTEKFRWFRAPLRGRSSTLDDDPRCYLVEYNNKLVFIVFDCASQLLQTWTLVDSQKKGTWIHQTTNNIADFFRCKKHKFFLDRQVGNDSLLLYHLDGHTDLDSFNQDHIDLDWYRTLVYTPNLAGQVINFTRPKTRSYFSVLHFIPNLASLYNSA